MTDLLTAETIQLDARADDQTEAIRAAGSLLVAAGAVDAPYIEAMLEREASVSTYMGEGVAIPHGTVESKAAVHRDALSLVRFPDGVDWKGHTVHIAIGIAALGDHHVGILARLASVLVDPERARALREAEDAETVLRTLTVDDDGEDTP